MSLPKGFGGKPEKPLDSCLKFNKNSWHYKLVFFLYGRWYFPIPQYSTRKISLCKYFWTVVTGVFIFPFIKLWRSLPYSIRDHEDLGRAISIWAVICGIIHIVAWSFLAEYWWLGFTVFFSVLGVGALIGAVIIFIIDLIDKHREKQSKKTRRPSLLKEFIKARKNKVCPCIEFVEDKDES